VAEDQAGIARAQAFDERRAEVHPESSLPARHPVDPLDRGTLEGITQRVSQCVDLLAAAAPVGSGWHVVKGLAHLPSPAG
jgi:hypothetical protein